MSCICFALIFEACASKRNKKDHALFIECTDVRFLIKDTCIKENYNYFVATVVDDKYPIDYLCYIFHKKNEYNILNTVHIGDTLVLNIKTLGMSLMHGARSASDSYTIIMGDTIMLSVNNDGKQGSSIIAFIICSPLIDSTNRKY